LLGDVVAKEVGESDGRECARVFYADSDPEIRGVLEQRGELPERDPNTMPTVLSAVFERIDVAYYEGDAAEIGSLELNKVVGVEAAFDVLGIEDPFALVMGDSKSDLRVMEWVAEGKGIAAAPEHASRAVLDHVIRTDELVFNRGEAPEILRVVYALNRLATLQ
jgi:hydroxymethylpyrimidine pyrophosphatase-like HAD family hydrolase